MAITLAEAKVGMADHVDQSVIDMFQRSSFLMDQLVFDNAVSPGTGGSTLVYGYTQLKTPSTAAVRALNSEYTAGEAKREEKTVNLVTMGGSFELDRVIINTAGAVDELQFQAQQKVKAVSNYYHNLIINGTSASSGTGYVTNTFDGLRKTLTGKSTAVASATDFSTADNVKANYFGFISEVGEWLSLMDDKPSMLLMNSKMLQKFKAAANAAGYYTRAENAFGRTVDMFDGIALIDAGKYYNGTSTVDVIADTAATTTAEGSTDIYALRIGLDGVCGVSMTGNNLINTYMPDLTAPGAVKKGEIEMTAGLAVKNTLAAGMLTGVKIAPKASA